MPGLDVVGLGRAPLDTIYIIDHFPIGDDLIRVEEASLQGGGPVPNALCALSRLGAATALIDRVGDDWQGRKIREFLEKQNVMTDFMEVEAGCRSTVSTILVELATGKRAIINYRGDTSEPSLGQVEINLISEAQILHITGTYPDTVRWAAGLNKPGGGKVSFDGGAGLYKEADRQILPKVDYCITAYDYAQKYTGKDSIPEMLDDFLSEGVEVAGITRGTEGSWFKDRGGNDFHQPAFTSTKILDTTGCGDVFHGIFLYGMLKHFPLQKAVRYASAGASIVSTRMGGSLSTPTLEEIIQIAGE